MVWSSPLSACGEGEARRASAERGEGDGGAAGLSLTPRPSLHVVERGSHGVVKSPLRVWRGGVMVWLSPLSACGEGIEG